jgi:hypothetical protein
MRGPDSTRSAGPATASPRTLAALGERSETRAALVHP